MSNNVYYFMGLRDARAMRPATWQEGWSKAQCAAYEEGYNSVS